MKRVLILIAALAASALYWALAQPAPPALASLFPPDAMLYLEAADFSSLLAGWNASPEKNAWLQSANYDQFSRSHLFLRLQAAQSEFAAAAGAPADYALVSSIAGGNSALALYNIGELEFLYITHLPSARAAATVLWKARANAQTRHAGGADYYIKEDAASHRTVAFAYTGDLLIVATREDLIAGALALHQQPAPSLAAEPWFVNAARSAAPGPRDLRLVYNLDRLRAAPQFRSYWVQRNAPDLAEFSAGLADLERASTEFRERRVLLRSAAAAAPDESATGPLLAAVPDDAGFYRVWLHPQADQARRLIEEKIYAATPAPTAPAADAPPLEATPGAGTEQDLETRIDQTPLTDDRVAEAFRPLQDRLAATKLDGILQVERTRAGGVFIAPESALVLLANTPWDPNAIRAALDHAAASLWSTAGLQDRLRPVTILVDGRWLFLGNAADLVNEIAPRRNRTAPGAAYAAAWRHARELPNFERITRLIDFPQIPPADPNTPAAPREPMFFSENLASLGRVLGRVQSAEIAAHDTGALLRENVVYRIAP